jgi:hypothetical protein
MGMTISVIVLTGQYAGETKVMPENLSALELLGCFANEDIKWEIDFEEATVNETLEWSRADMVSRILAALFHGRQVRFEHAASTRQWRLEDCSTALTLPVSGNEAVQVVGEIHDAISDSGMNVYIAVDDDTGVTIGTHGTEHKLQ